MSQARTQEKHGEEKKGKEFVARGGAPAKENGNRDGYIKRKKWHGRRWVELEMLCSWCGNVGNQLRWKMSWVDDGFEFK